MAVKSRIGARKLRMNFQLNFIRNLDARATRVEGRCWPRVDGRSVRLRLRFKGSEAIVVHEFSAAK
jgi:ribosomal protein L32E